MRETIIDGLDPITLDGDGNGPARDGEGAALDGHGVVRVGVGLGGHGDLVLVDILAGLAAERVDRGCAIGGLAGHRRDQLGVGRGVVVVDLALVVRLDGDRGGLDRERAGDLDVVVVGAVGRAVGLGNVPDAIVDLGVGASVGALDGGRALEAERLAGHHAGGVIGIQLELLLGAVVGDGVGAGQRDLGLVDGHGGGPGGVLVVGVDGLHVDGLFAVGDVGPGGGGGLPGLVVGRVVERRTLVHGRGGGHGVGLAVVGAGVAGDGHRHGALGDGQRRGNVGDVVVPVRRLGGLVIEADLKRRRYDLSLVGACVLLLARERDRGQGVAANEALDGHELCVLGCRVGAGRALRIAVVGVALRDGGDGHGLGSDVEGAVGDVEGDLEVGVDIDELVLVQAHRVHADIGALGDLGAAVGEVARHVVEVGVCGGGVVGDGLLGAVVNLLFGVALDGDDDLERRDLEGHGRAGHEGHVQVGIIVGGLGDVDVLGIRVGKLAGHGGGAGVGDLGGIEEGALGGRGHGALEGLGLAVVVLGGGVAVQGDGNRGLVDRELAGDRDGVVGGAVIAVRLGNVPDAVVDIRVGADVGALDGGRALEAQGLASHHARCVGSVELELLLCAVVGDGGAAGQRDLGLVDGQRTGCVRYHVVGRDAGDLRLILCGRVIARARIGDRRGLTESPRDHGVIARQRSRDGVVACEGRSVVRLVTALRLDGQRERVVDRDDVAVGRHRNRLARVVGVDREVLLLIRRDRGRGVLGADNLLRLHIVSDLGCGALEVVVHRDIGLVQLEVRDVRMRLIQAVGVLLRNERGIRADGLGPLIDGPVIENVGVGRSGRGGAGGGSGVNLHRLARGRDRTHSLLAISHHVVDGDLVLLPHGEEILVGLPLVGRDLGRGGTVGRGVLAAVPHEEVGGGPALALGPTLEGVAGAGLRAENVHCLVDLDVGIRVIQGTLAVVLRAVVAVPVDVRRGLDALVLIHCLQLDGVVVVMLAVIDDLINNFMRSGISNLRVGHVDSEGPASGDGRLGVNVLLAVPRLQHPVIEELACGGCRRSAGAHARVVLVQGGVVRCIGATVGIIDNADSLSADNNLGPLGVEVELLGDPEAVDVAVRGRPITPPIHGVGHMRFLVVGLATKDSPCGGKHLCARLVCVPTVELIARANTGGSRHLPAVIDAEVHVLGRGAPPEAWVGSRVRVQEHAELNLAPLGVDGQAALGHGGEVIGMRAGIIDVPALKHIARRSSRFEVVSAALVVRRQVCTVGNTADNVKLALTGLGCDAIIVTVVVCAVHVVDGVGITGVVEADSPVVIKARMTLRIIRRICSELRIAGDVGELFAFGRDKI